jgi:hypothetical protein
MPTAKDNLVEEVLRIIDTVRAERERVLREELLTAASVDAYLHDVQTLLCRLVSSMISAPLSGRMDIMPPEAYVSPEERGLSLDAQI